MNANAAVRTLGALAQQSRLTIFRALVQAGPSGVAAGDIGKRTRIAPSSLSFHLKELSHAGLVRSRQEGRFIFYAADYDKMNALIAFLTENCCGGDDCRVACAPPSKKRSS